MSSTADQAGDGGPDDLVRRPPGRLHDLPVEARWEVTRRHPYYLALWEEARRYRRGPPDDPPGRKLFGFAATLVLGAIGVYGEPVSPAEPFAELAGPAADPAFLCGSVQPVTLRHVVAMLLTSLPAADRAFVGSLLARSGMEEYFSDGGAGGRPDRLAAAQQEFARTPSAALDSCPDAPLFYVHLGASQRAIVRDAEDQVRRWKARRGLGSSKVQAAKLPKYLRAWDLREGWTDGGYDRGRELRFADVAKRLRLPLSTAVAHFRSAFAHIVGHEFAPELWWRVFGPLKFSRQRWDPAASYSAGTLRRLRSPAPRPVPDTVISPAPDNTRRTGTVESGSAVADKVGHVDLWLDLRDLIAHGLSDDEVARRLELNGPELVAEFRRTAEELGLASR